MLVGEDGNIVDAITFFVGSVQGVGVVDVTSDESGVSEGVTHFFVGMRSLDVDFLEDFVVAFEVHFDADDFGFGVVIAFPVVFNKGSFSLIFLIEHFLFEGVWGVEVENETASRKDVLCDLVDCGAETFEGGDVVEAIEKAIGSFKSLGKIEGCGVGDVVVNGEIFDDGFSASFGDHLFAEVETGDLVA